MSIEELVSVSRKYGQDPSFVLAGGGNTSFKTASHLYIKASGFTLATITPDGFACMERKALASIWTKQYPETEAEREAQVLADLMASRSEGGESRRPSVETLLHDLIPDTFVVHTHPALVNGITCSAGAEQAARSLFDDQIIWIPSTNPGYILSLRVKEALEEYRSRKGCEPLCIILQNHGIFVSAGSIAEIDARYEKIMNRISLAILRHPDMSGRVESYGDSDALCARLSAVAADSGTPASVLFRRDTETARFIASRESFSPLSSSFTPDHIVYAGSEALFIEEPADLEIEWSRFVKRTGRKPRIAAVRGTGIFGLGSSQKAARLALDLFSDAMKVAVYTESFGGPRFMSQDQIDFINGWEVERYRSKVSGG